MEIADASPPGSEAALKTILVCDIVDSTRLVDRHGDQRTAVLFRRHDETARELLRGEFGLEIDKSDGFLLLFDRPIQAVRFALAYHDRLKEISEEHGVELTARVGVHLGEVLTRRNSPEDVASGAKPLEVEGLAKPIAARLMSLARGRQILLTQAAFDVARRSVVGSDMDHEGLRWRAHGRYRLKGIAEPVEVFEVGLIGLAPLMPPAGTQKAERVTGPERPGILVLPFASHSHAEDTDFISDGLADEISTSLSGLESLRVVSRASAQQLKGTEKSLLQIGSELNVEFVLEGTVRRIGDRLRISARLIRVAEAEETVWADRYDGEIGDLFDIEETIARHVVDAFKLQLTKGEEDHLSGRPIPNAQAYEYYLRAKQLIYTFRPDALERALEYLRKGLEILGDNPELTSAMGYVYWQYFNIGISSDPVYLEKARECAERVLAVSPHSPDGHRLLGMVEILAKGDSEDVVRHLRLALASDPNNSDALFWLSLIYGFVGRSSSAYPLIERLLRIDPLTPLYRMVPGYLAMLDGDLERAEPSFSEAHALEPANPMITMSYGQLRAMAGDVVGACELFDRLRADDPDSFFAALGLLLSNAIRGRRDEMLAAVSQPVADAASADLQYSWILAQCHALVGETDAALDWLENSIKQGCANYPLFAARDPLLEGIRGTARFKALMEALRERWERFDI